MYDGSLRRIIHAFKYQGHQSLAKPLADLMRRTASDVIDGGDVAVAVPLHVSRAWHRGFNQADALARHLPLRRVAALRRRRRTPTQARLDAQARAHNVRGAFAPAWRLRVAAFAARHGRGGFRLSRRAAACVQQRWSVEGLVVVLVDDVRTTGATLEACAAVLRACGAREVRALTVALVVHG